MSGNLFWMADRVQALDDVGVDVDAVILGALHEQGLIDQIAQQVLFLVLHLSREAVPGCNSGTPRALRLRGSARLFQVFARDDVVVYAGDDFLDHDALGVCAAAGTPRLRKQREKSAMRFGFIGVTRPPVYRFVSRGSNTFLTLSATRPRRSRRIQSVPLGSSRNPSFCARINFTRFSGDSGVSG
jgi:hypothetical protein